MLIERERQTLGSWRSQIHRLLLPSHRRAAVVFRQGTYCLQADVVQICGHNRGLTGPATHTQKRERHWQVRTTHYIRNKVCTCVVAPDSFEMSPTDIWIWLIVRGLRQTHKHKRYISINPSGSHKYVREWRVCGCGGGFFRNNCSTLLLGGGTAQPGVRKTLSYFMHTIWNRAELLLCVSAIRISFPFFYFVVSLSRFDPRGVVANDADLLSAFDWEFLVVVCVCKC